MKCVRCNGPTEVKETREVARLGGTLRRALRCLRRPLAVMPTRRRRKCRECGHAFTTLEVYVADFGATDLEEIKAKPISKPAYY